MTCFEAGWDHGWYFGAVDKFKTRYLFDALGRRIAKLHGYVDEQDHSQCDLKHNIHHHEHFATIAYSYLADQDKILVAKDVGGALSLYLDGQGMDDHLGEIRHGQARGYVVDHLGSVMNLGASGGVALYGAFGEMVGFAPTLALVSEPSIYGYAGRQFDPESGLYYMRARMYDPAIGRFLTQDPVGFAGGDVNLYRYVTNAPTSFTGPLGLWNYKPGTNGSGLQTPITDAEPTVDNTFVAYTGNIAVATYTTNGQHSGSSFHYEGYAVDLRANNLDSLTASEIATDLQIQLGSDYQVFYETFSDPSNNHIHVQYSPSGGSCPL